MPIHIRRATPADLDAIARINAACFMGDAISSAIYPARLASTEQDELTTQITCRKFRMARRIHDPSAAIFVAVEKGGDGDGGEGGGQEGEVVVGFNMWDLPKGEWELDEETKEGFEERAKELVGVEAYERSIKCVDMELFAKVKKLMEKMAIEVLGEEGKDDAYYLAFLCVDPAHHRKGIGKQLMQWGVDEAASQAKDAWLVGTPAGVRLYHTCGFETVGETDFFGVPHTTMLLKNSPSIIHPPPPLPAPLLPGIHAHARHDEQPAQDLVPGRPRVVDLQHSELRHPGVGAAEARHHAAVRVLELQEPVRRAQGLVVVGPPVPPVPPVPAAHGLEAVRRRRAAPVALDPHLGAVAQAAVEEPAPDDVYQAVPDVFAATRERRLITAVGGGGVVYGHFDGVAASLLLGERDAVRLVGGRGRRHGQFAAQGLRDVVCDDRVAE
ncbi:uncharacterized protein E0L32_009893 [Thyridium curvatum]|uniref:N-acetyltransferase domain-containing protein n=1 Tax=Thyridium curvatum TaxID=1093900 RepID=A0A507AQD9_9PEZI|nr:uncharacterized protein E0L32_009893 [Thyridium curvatum]TPX08704.1 hypothetical protein E0L32_009893 [Thyridium curvatum]